MFARPLLVAGALFFIGLLDPDLQGAELVFNLDAARLPSGEVSALPGKAGAPGWETNSPVLVGQAGGRPALLLSEGHKLISQFALPAGFETRPFTAEAWVLNPEIARAETIFCFAPPKGGGGAEFNYGASATDGAFRQGFKATVSFTRVPVAQAWHHFAWLYEGGVLRVFVDGELETEKKLKLSLAPGSRIHIGASGEVDNEGPKRPFSGAVAQVRVWSGALSQAELRLGAAFRAAYAPEPKEGTVLESLQTVLRWRQGVPEAASYRIYTSFTKGELDAPKPATVKALSQPEFGPLTLPVNGTLYWRVDELDRAGQVLAPGPVWNLTANPGLAAEALPRDHDGNVAASTNELKWRPGPYASKQRLFLAEAVDRLTTPVAELPSGANSFHLAHPLAPGVRYFWRVDSDNGTQPPSHGTVWTFRTQDQAIPHDVTFFVSSDCHYGRENNAAVNRKIINLMNDLPGEALPASVGGGFVRTPRGVVLNGDLLDEGFNPESAPALWEEFCRDYGLTGQDGRLCYPVYEGFGNHDGGPSKSFVRKGIRERNRRRVALAEISPGGLHYSWDWDQLHLVQLNLFGGSSPADVKGVNGPEHDPEDSLAFLQADLAKNVGQSGRPVIAFQHFAWLGGMSDWWQPDAKERFYETIKDYQVPCLINGHSHGAAFVPWHGLLTIHDGSTARGEGDNGDFMVVHVTERQLTVIQRKLVGGWGISKMVALPVKAALP